jgi:hypothetical protein
MFKGASYNVYQIEWSTGQSWSGVLRTHCPPGGWNGSSCTTAEDEGVALALARGHACRPERDRYPDDERD